MIDKLSWDEYYVGIAESVAKRASCIRRQVGSVIVRNNRLISTGYNGTPRGTLNCDRGGCTRCNTPKDQMPSGAGYDTCVCSHAEENAIVQAAYHGIKTKGSEIYSTLSPCLFCAKLIINAGIVAVISKAEHIDSTKDLLISAGVRWYNIGSLGERVA